MAVSGEDGTFEIKNIPAGKQEFRVLAGSARLLEEFEIQGRRDEQARSGRSSRSRTARQLDLGDIKVPASVLQ